MQVQVATHEGAPRFVELPVTVELEVKHTRSGSAGRPLHGRHQARHARDRCRDPGSLFINTGDKLKVDSRDGNYLGRVNSWSVGHA